MLSNGSCNLKSNAAKRKSAVELLQESKAFYVKSEQVLDSKQELKHSEHLQVTANPNFDVLLKTPVAIEVQLERYWVSVLKAILWGLNAAVTTT